LLSLIGSGTLIIENFSSRVLPNLGLDPAILLGRGASLVRLPASRMRSEWRGLGSGIELAAGLGRPASDGTLTCAPIPLTDALSGLSAALHGVVALRHRPGMYVIGQLEDVATPLARRAHACACHGTPNAADPNARFGAPAMPARLPWQIR
jgi:hypothetical protein